MVSLRNFLRIIAQQPLIEDSEKQEGKAESAGEPAEKADRTVKWDSMLDSISEMYSNKPAIANFVWAIYGAKKCILDQADRYSCADSKEFQDYFAGIREKIGAHYACIKEPEADKRAKIELEKLLDDYSKSHKPDEAERFKNEICGFLTVSADSLEDKHRTSGFDLTMQILKESVLRGKEDELHGYVYVIKEEALKIKPAMQPRTPEERSESVYKAIAQVLDCVMSGRDPAYLKQKLSGSEELGRN